MVQSVEVRLRLGKGAQWAWRSRGNHPPPWGLSLFLPVYSREEGGKEDRKWKSLLEFSGPSRFVKLRLPPGAGAFRGSSETLSHPVTRQHVQFPQHM